ALGRLPARPDRGSSRGASALARRRPPVAAASTRDGGGNRAAHRRRHRRRDRPHRLHRSAADETLRGDLGGVFPPSRDGGDEGGRPGMIYDVRQTTTYAYASPAAYAHHVLRLVPIARERQRVTAAVLDIDPQPVRRREGRDFFENRTTMVEID